MIADLIRLARPKQWVKGAFVLLGPLYGMVGGAPVDWPAVAFAFVAFGLASSGCYIINDVRDVESDRAHPRKKQRPVASGRVQPGTALAFAAALFGGAAVAALAPLAFGTDGSRVAWLAFFVGLYALNVSAYSLGIKHVVVVDVISLAAGFVLRVLGGCAAAGVEPSTWLLNCTFFVSMFLAFGKRLGERRTMGDGVGTVRAVQNEYTDELLRMAVVVTGVASLGTYAAYVQAQGHLYTARLDGPQGWGMNLLWLTMLPATFGLLRCIVQVEKGAYDDPTELAAGDRPFQIGVALFGVVTLLAIWLRSPA